MESGCRTKDQNRECIGTDGRENDRHKAGQRVLHHHHLKGEDDTGQWGVEGGGDTCRRATPNQGANGIVWQLQRLPHQTAAGSAKKDIWPLSADGVATDDRYCCTEKL